MGKEYAEAADLQINLEKTKVLSCHTAWVFSPDLHLHKAPVFVHTTLQNPAPKAGTPQQDSLVVVVPLQNKPLSASCVGWSPNDGTET